MGMKKALITGANKGIGFETAKQLLQKRKTGHIMDSAPGPMVFPPLLQGF